MAGFEIRELDAHNKPAARVSLDELAAQAGRKSRKAAGSSITEKVSEPEPIPVTVDPAVVKSTFKIGFQAGYLITNFEGWKLTEEEATYLQKAWQPVFDKYIAPRFAEFIIIFNAIGALGTMTFKKLMDQRKWQLEQKEAKLKAEQAAATQS